MNMAHKKLKAPKTIEDILNTLKRHRRKLSRMKVKHIAVFGSFARKQARAKSDVDILIEFSESVGFFHFCDVQEYLESMLGRKVDLVTADAVRPELKGQIEKEMIRAA